MGSNMGFKMKDYVAKAREVVAEGVVLLKNDGNVLPLLLGTKAAIFGCTQFDYYKSGLGSGGLVNTNPVNSILDALQNEQGIEINEELIAIYKEWLILNPTKTDYGWGAEPWFKNEMPITSEIAIKAKSKSDVAIVVLGRTAGEDKDNKVEEGSYLLTEQENELLNNVCSIFEKTVVLLNTGNIIDMNWVNTYNPSAVAYIWQGGQEGANGAIDVVMGRVCPSGKLPDTLVYDVNDIYSTAYFGNTDKLYYAEDIYVGYRYFETFAPEKVMYPFGYGMSYTNFSIEPVQFLETDMGYEVQASILNAGHTSGKEVLQVYVSAPQGKLGKPVKSLCGFTKTKMLAPGESELVKVFIPKYYISSYDDSGVTGYKSAYVLEEGVYTFFVGNDVRNVVKVGEFTQAKIAVLEQLTEAVAPTEKFDILKPSMENHKLVEGHIAVTTRTKDYNNRIKENAPISYKIIGDKGYKLSDVSEGKVTIEEFIAQLSVEDLVAIVRGEGMCSPKVTPGIAGAMGGVTENLLHFGLPIAGCSDGPSGIRLDSGTLAFSMPNGTLLASTFNKQLNQELYEWEALELRKNKIDTLLGPGMNIHRNPLNGRNFEYFSEDPILTGKMAAAQLRGMHKYGVTGTIKHFACNNQETKRNEVETIVSERALREIYLKGFEIAVKEEGAYSIMTSYNPVNGYWTASHYELLTVILREEWNFKGIVMTDWWAKGNYTGEDGTVDNTSAKAQAQNDLNMVNLDASDMECDNAITSLESGRVTIGDYQRCAKNICEYLLRTPAFSRMMKGESTLDKELENLVFEGGPKITKFIEWVVKDAGVIAGTEIATSKNDLNLITLKVEETGHYKLQIICRAEKKEPELAQIPLTIFRDRQVLDSFTLIGSQKEWTTYCIDELDLTHKNNCYLKLYFGQSGMEIRELRLIKNRS